MHGPLSYRPPARGGLVTLLFAFAFFGCESTEPSLDSAFSAPPQALCTANVAGRWLSVETDYLPHVVACENGGADFEALKAQAVAARSYLYYRILFDGSIGDGTHDQVYTCDNPVLEQHIRAVEETSGQVLRYGEVQIAAFFVAGAYASAPDCIGGWSDPSGTEPFVTYNDGLTGAQVEKSGLGAWVPANRGCMSQHGSDCLSLAGRTYEQILRFYYGRDIQIVQAQGECVLPIAPDPGPDPAGCTGTNDAGEALTVASGQSFCGADFQMYHCQGGTMSPTGIPCGDPPVCCTDPVQLRCQESICLGGEVFRCFNEELLVATGALCGS